MDANNVVAAFAFGIGFIQMYQDYMRSDTMTPEAKNSVLLGLLASCLWLIYQSRKYGMNFTVSIRFCLKRQRLMKIRNNDFTFKTTNINSKKSDPKEKDKKMCSSRKD